MTAAAYAGSGRIILRNPEATQPESDQVRIRVAYTGICGTDLHVLHGDMDQRVTIPAILGHEMSGTIDALGADVTGLGVGERVTVMPLSWCGDCPACRAGHQHVCQRLTFMGIDSPGSMQTTWNVPARTVIPLPDGLSLRDAALAEPTAVAAHDVRRAGVRAGDRVLVVGGGPIGLLIACLSRDKGADVVVVEVNPARASLLAGLGFRVLEPGEDVDRRIDGWTEDAGVDVAFEVSGVAAGLDLAVRSTRVRGTITVVAIHAAPRPTDLHRVFWRELMLLGARVYERDDFTEALRCLAEGVVPTDALITAVLPLSSAPDAFDQLAQGGPVMKILISSEEAPR